MSLSSIGSKAVPVNGVGTRSQCSSHLLGQAQGGHQSLPLGYGYELFQLTNDGLYLADGFLRQRDGHPARILYP
jgi:hypothetical protein